MTDENWRNRNYKMSKRCYLDPDLKKSEYRHSSTEISKDLFYEEFITERRKERNILRLIYIPL